MDISNIAVNVGVNLEHTALDKFGAAVGNFAYQKNLGPLGAIANPLIHGLGNALFGGSVSSAPRGQPPVQGDWTSSKYADDLVAFAPKHRFIFKVRFIFNDPYSRINREFMYVVREIDKPKVAFEYEDVNMYNFRTKVLKAIRHEPLTMSFHDDIQNKVLDFFNAYRLAYSPISSLDNNQSSAFESAGMDFYPPDGGPAGVNSASIGLLEGGNVNVLNYIEVIQIYAHGTRQTSFLFANPRIEQFDFDNLAHESSEGNGLTVSFNYDSLKIMDSVPTGTPDKWGRSDILGNVDVSAPRSPYGNMMGGNPGSSTSFPGAAKDARGLAIHAPTSAFPGLSSALSGAVSSTLGAIGGRNSTLGLVLPSINQATSGLQASAFSNIGNFSRSSLPSFAQSKNVDNASNEVPVITSDNTVVDTGEMAVV